MTRHKTTTPAVTRDGLVADLRMLADLAEAKGDRFVALRALKYAWRIENCCPARPVPRSVDGATLH